MPLEVPAVLFPGPEAPEKTPPKAYLGITGGFPPKLGPCTPYPGLITVLSPESME